jgi:type IV pilus assembly protein PilC
MCHFCQTASMLLKAGLLLPEIMDTAIQATGNRIMCQALRDVREKLVQGQGLSQPMAAIDLFPRLLAEMIAVGEKTGNLDATLATLADYYEERVDQRINTLTSMLEPALTVGIALVVGLIALSIITPLYSIVGSVQ